MSRYGDGGITHSHQVYTWAILTLCLGACSDDDVVSLAQCELSIECPRPFFCNYGQCSPLDAIDRDGDNIPEEVEAQLGLNPESSDSDGDGQSDFAELDFDSNTREYLPRDRDNDGIIDALESDSEDADGDGYSDEADPCNLDPDCPTQGGQSNDCSDQLGEVCVYGVGACEVLGLIECAPSSRDAVCAGEDIPPNEESCDGSDNDCDGHIDEDFGEVGATCTPGIGLCRASGIIRCDSPSSASCDVAPGLPAEESCDGSDNDCDGRVDEDFELGAPCESGEGLCIRAGVLGCDEARVNARCLPMVVDDAPETCDGMDNDCDGLVDEGFGAIGDPCEDGTEACVVQGVLACNLEGTALICSAEATQSTAEMCNNTDDDCDGQIDETFDQKGSACVGGMGECAYEGLYVCNEAGSALTCDTDMPSISDERCDTLDNDCDGQIDEAFPELGGTCTVGVGACLRTGEVICDSISARSRCDARAGFGSIERCNGVDDDCDGITDETFAGVGESCETNQGVCRFTGMRQCDPAGMLTCISRTPIQGDERCDGIDNDCDEQIDEDLGVGEPCTLNTGGCERMGAQTCAADGTVYCTANPLPETQERCDDLDNDCDGRIDEDFQNLNEACDVAVGVCRGAGRYECAANENEVVCNAVPEGTPTDERCDGLDNDCDGFSDESYVGLGDVCFSGEFGCAVEGRSVCDQAQAGLVCDATALPATDETCNNADDNCNGEVDENFPDKNRPCTTGLGACETTGQLRCSDDEADVVCTVESAPSPTIEICDDIDNDCDGSVDENYGPGCRLLISAVSSSDFFTCMRTPDFFVRCFGDVPAVTPQVQADAMDGGGNDHCLITLDADIRCWGASADLSQSPEGRFSQLSVGRNSDACALGTPSGLAACWGDTLALNIVPQAPLDEIAVADNWACGVTRDTGSIQCWGDVPEGSRIPSDVGYSQLTMGGALACALDAQSAIACWGRDTYDMLAPPSGRFDRLSIGANSGCAMGVDDLPTCWGLGSPARPHLGQGIPPDGIRFRDISVGAYHVCGVRNDDTISCWGAGSVADPVGPFNAGQATPP